MNVLLSCVVVVLTVVVAGAGANPRRYTPDGQPSQACGDKLADIMMLVCHGRGYNAAFRSHGRSSHRVRRGIVEECCRKSCSPAMLELYCQAEPIETTSNVIIRKRSDSGDDSNEPNNDRTTTSSKITTTEVNKFVPLEDKVQQNDALTTNGEGKENYKLLNLLVSSEHSTHKHGPRKSSNSLIPNDTLEKELYRQSTTPVLRHHKNHHNMRVMHEHKGSSKTKREKMDHGENTQTYQIGTVKPYFSGKALASYRSSFKHHS